ncbi:MAG: ABC transporter ATP-binding protein [bacterium]|nr:ABC transporter ATP-binding protein [bacterium]
MIKTIGLTKRFGDVLAVDDLSLDIPEGEIFGFLGPNGAGKTTTIKLLTGLLQPDKGQVFIGRYDIQKDYILAKQLIGYVSDSPFLYDKLTGREFLSFVSGIYRINRPDRIEELLSLFNIAEYGDRLIEEYSHGIRQRLVICSVLLHNPKVIIIDEPMVGLDPRSSKILKDRLRESAKNGVTIFLSTHTLSVAEELCTKIGVIHRGKLIALGTIPELREMVSTEGKLEDVFLQLTEE